MTRYLVLPTLIVFALGLGAGWLLRAGRSTPRDVWDDARWWSKGFDDGLRIESPVVLPAQPFNPCGPHALGVRDDRFLRSPDSADTWSVRWDCPERPPDWKPFPCNGECSP